MRGRTALTSLWTSLVASPEAALEQFASPFDELGPPPLARSAAALLQKELGAGWISPQVSTQILDAPEGGKMFGVLVAETADGRRGFLRAFSGTIQGRFDLPGYCPPLFDRKARVLVELPGERVVKQLTIRGDQLLASTQVAEVREAARQLAELQQEERARMRARHTTERERRHQERTRLRSRHLSDVAADEATFQRLDQESRRDKAELRRLGAAHAAVHARMTELLAGMERSLRWQADLRRAVSRRLMREIHASYRVENFLGEQRKLRGLYPHGGPPGGAADCAAPKLLACAYSHGLRPLALAEFWWGQPPAGGGRVHGAFYPSCRPKCGPLLPFMLQGLKVTAPRRFSLPDSTALELAVVYEDEWIVVVDKPCGLLSVPSREGGDSVAKRLAELYTAGEAPLMVHRLDLDTSGLLVAARDAGTHAALQRQFLQRKVLKRYVAIVEGSPAGDRGVIELPLRVDVHDRPRQIHDAATGRPAVTEWKVLERLGNRTRIAFSPRTGRTHQLRVHASHPLGLGLPIVGDRLYGHEDDRLMLHAETLEFLHPGSGERVRFESPALF